MDRVWKNTVVVLVFCISSANQLPCVLDRVWIRPTSTIPNTIGASRVLYSTGTPDWLQNSTVSSRQIMSACFGFVDSFSITLNVSTSIKQSLVN